MSTFLAALAPAMPVLMPTLLSAIVAFLKRSLLKKVSPQYFPVILTLGGAMVNAASVSLGADVHVDLENVTEASITGAVVGLSTVGVHQLATKTRKKV